MIRLASGVDMPVFDANTKPDPAYFVGLALIRDAVNGDKLLFSDGAEWVNVGGSGGGVATLAPVFKGGFAPPDGEVGVPYSYDLSALFSGTVESYVVYNGALSNGLTLNAVSGILSGTPTGALTIPSFSVAALNAHGGAISNAHDFVVTVAELNPATLFANGEQGVAYDPYDLTSLYQNASGSTPVTAAWQPVEKILDKSGNGNHAVSPVGKAGALGGLGGRRILTVNSSFQTPAIDFSNTDKITVVAEIGSINTATAIAIELSADGYATSGGFYVSAPNGSSANDYGFAAHGTSGAAYRATPYQTRSHVITCVFDLAGGALATEIKPTIDGVIPTLSSAAGTTCGTGNFANAVLNFGSRNGGASLPMIGALGRTIVISRELTSDELLSARQWVGKFNKTVIASVGDSTVAPYLGYRGLIQNIDCAGANIAVPGNTIAQQKTLWTARTDKAGFDAVIVQVGLNDLNPAEAASVAIARLQDLIDTINADVAVPVYIAKMIPCRQRLIDLYGVDGPASYQKWLDMNEAIAGGGATPITGVDARITAHEPLMNDGSGNLKAEYDHGDHIHPNDAGRLVNSSAWYDALTANGIL